MMVSGGTFLTKIQTSVDSPYASSTASPSIRWTLHPAGICKSTSCLIFLGSGSSLRLELQKLWQSIYAAVVAFFGSMGNCLSCKGTGKEMKRRILQEENLSGDCLKLGLGRKTITKKAQKGQAIKNTIRSYMGIWWQSTREWPKTPVRTTEVFNKK